MKKLIIDSRIRQEEYEYLSKYFIVEKLELSEDVYEEISGHADIFYCKINNEIIAAPNAKIKNKNFKIGKSIVKNTYPFDISYNVCQIGNKIIGSKYTDKSINVNILVKQGYTKCSIVVTSNNSCITTDRKISEILNRNNIDALYVEEDNINLLLKDGTKSFKKGFIGGASFVFDNKFILFGDFNKLTNSIKIREYLKKYNLEIVDFKNLEINDYGGVLIY